MAWQKTDLSSDPPSKQFADTDRRTLSISAGDTALSVAVKFVDTDAPATDLSATLVESAVMNATNDGAHITISGLTRGKTYELSTIFTSGDGGIWTVTTAIDCVA